MIGSLKSAALRRPDVAAAVMLGGAIVLCNLLYLPGHAALQAWRNFNNPIVYADRYAFPELFPNDRIISHLRDIYPFLSIVYWAPAVLLKFLAIRPEHVTFVEVVVNDPLIAVAVFWLGRAFGLSLGTSVVAALFTITSKVLSWDLGGYEYYGHDFAYSGSFYLPFAIAVIPSLISRRYVLAVVLATITALVFAPAGALMCGVIVLVLVVKRADGEWRRVAPWFGLPLLIFAWSAVIQMAIGARITERFTPAEDVAVVMANGHLVPLWLSGQIFASTYLGFFLWCAMSALAWGKWRALDANQRLPILILAAFMVAGAIAGFIAVQIGWPFLLRLGPFRYFLLLGVIVTPLIVAELVERMTAGDIATRAIAVLLFALFAVDRGTAWMLPLTLPCVAFLALRRRLGEAGRVAAPIVAALGIVASLDILLRVGIGAAVARQIDGTGRLAALVEESGRRLEGAAPELLILVIVLAAVGLWLRKRHSGIALPAALTVFLLACVFIRTATNAAWAASGPPMRFAEAQLWGRDSTPVAAKFIFLELEPGGSYPSWQTLSQRAAAEMQYTHQKVYLPDRSLLEIDKAVSANYGFDPATVDGQLYPFYAYGLQQKYLQFSEKDFLRVARLSGSNFAVLKKPRTLGFPIAFENDLFAIYRMPAQFSGIELTPLTIGDGGIVLTWNAAERPDYRARVVFRDAQGETVATDCCVTIGSSAGSHRFHLPAGAKGTFLALVGLVDAATGAALPLEGDASGENLAFWEYVVAD
jgi:hypothetical protein